MREVDKAYVAGFLDGDGSIVASIEPNKKLVAGYRVRVILKFSQCLDNRALLAELHKMIGYGYISKSRQAVEYVIKSKNDLKKLLEDLKPYVRSKKNKYVWH